MSDAPARTDRRRSAPGPTPSLAVRMQRFVEALQRRICTVLERVDGAATFRSDVWERPGGGGGLTRVIEDGAVFEKGGVNTSAVHGVLPDRMARALGAEPAPFFATGLSLVLHPRSPYVPTVHANFRYFALGEDREHPTDQWFGGGADLTPYYPYLEDARHFHRVWQEVCARHPHVADYEAFKQQCDAYFFLPHRGEARGVGGIFYDHLRHDPEATFCFTREAGRAFLRAYLPIVHRRRDQPYGERERRYHEIRRGRYAEFNLLHDRGTRFGIETRGRTESILMSLPPRVQWRYDWQPEPGSPEAHASWFFQPRDWLRLPTDDGPPSPAS
ncbi:MAG: oxygen-dependent coproporphyrinogen oxidase [Bacteroidetes bacterium]|nr:MAG: oxygen-dependent coproporphyrinogen oxidase [Bacteroidota bacterium]